jgi:hypothetical protein
MADDVHTEHATADHAGEHDFHLPPNSWSPINVALSLTLCFMGTLSATWVWVVGLVWLIASLVAWFRGARTEFHDLPESSTEH